MRLRTSKVKQDTIDETIFSCYLNSFEPKSHRKRAVKNTRAHTHTDKRTNDKNMNESSVESSMARKLLSHTVTRNGSKHLTMYSFES